MKRIGLLLVALGFVGLASCPSHAASIRIEPAGSQLDRDPINDLLLSPGEAIELTILFENAADYFGPIPRPTRFIDYRVEFDPTELQYLDSRLDVSSVISDACFLGGPCGSSVAVGDGWLDVSHRTAFAKLLFPGPELILDVISFIATGVNASPGDGLADYSLSGSNRGALGLTISTFHSNAVEVQAVPSPMPILGVVSMFRFARRLRRRLSVI
jgi:hypothetical protein